MSMFTGCTEMRYLDQLRVLVWELAVRQFVSLDNPGVFENLPSSQSLMWVHMKHLRDQILKEEVAK